MADKKISQLDAAASLTGTEEVPVVQSGSTVKTTVQDIADLAASGAAPYESYVAIITFASGGFTELLLQNDFTGITYTWSNPTTNVLRITPSDGATFTFNKTVVFVNSYANEYLVTPGRTGSPTAGVINLTHTKHDGTTNTLSYGQFYIEIRVYP